MQTLKTWPSSILAVILWFAVAQAAPASAPEPQRNFASAEEAVSAFVAALRDHKEADLRAILGPEATASSTPVTVMPTANSISASLLSTMRSTRSTKRALGAPSWMLARTTGQCRSRWSRTTDAGLSTPRQVRRRSSTVASAATSCRRSARCSPASMRNTIISIVPSRQTAAASMPCAWSARPAVAMAFTGRWPRARTKARWGR